MTCWGALIVTVLLSAMCAAQQTVVTLPSAPSAVVADAAARQILWSAERDYQPLSRHQKFRHFARSLYSPYTFASELYDATWNQATGVNYGYGGGMEGWGKRLGAAYAGTASRQFFGYFLFPTLLHQDPRYFPLHNGSFLDRVKHAAERVIITRGDDGSTQFNTSGLLGMAATSSIENLWLPDRHRSGSDTANRMLGSIQGAATGYLLREFTPDFLRLFRRHAPKPLKKVEEKIPPQIISGTSPGDN